MTNSPSPTETSSLSEAEANPLAEVSPSSLDELFNRDPFDLSEADIGRIVEELRRARKNWLVAESAGKTKAPRASASKAPKVAADKSLSLDDLGL